MDNYKEDKVKIFISLNFYNSLNENQKLEYINTKIREFQYTKNKVKKKRKIKQLITGDSNCITKINKVCKFGDKCNRINKCPYMHQL